jgi:LysM repeat protein
MKTPRRALYLGGIGMLIVLGLMAGCYRPVAPDVTPTSPVSVEATPSAEELMETADAEAAETEEAPTETPTEEPTPIPSSTPTTAPATAAATTPAPTALPSAATPLPTGQTTHVVQRGENLFRIALRYGTTVQAIASANGIANPARIYVGQRLVIFSSGVQPTPQPGGETTYVVQRGDNLYRIALRYGLNYMYLAQYNGIANPSRIYAGQVLRIPPR